MCLNGLVQTNQIKSTCHWSLEYFQFDSIAATLHFDSTYDQIISGRRSTDPSLSPRLGTNIIMLKTTTKSCIQMFPEVRIQVVSSAKCFNTFTLHSVENVYSLSSIFYCIFCNNFYLFPCCLDSCCCCNKVNFPSVGFNKVLSLSFSFLL